MKTRVILLEALSLWAALPLSLAQPVFELDATFQPTITIPGGEIYRIIPQSGDKFIVNGEFQSIGGVACPNLTRLQADGSVDKSFIPSVSFDYVENMVIQTDGKLIISGRYIQGDREISGLFRLGLNGELETTFRVAFDYGNDEAGSIQRIVFQPDGKLLLGGWFNRINRVTRRGLARLNADGSLDPTFDAGLGLQGPSSSIVADHFSSPYAMVVQYDGKILLGGSFTKAGGVRRNGMARLNTDGTLDPTFDPGKIEQKLGGTTSPGLVWSIVLQASGQFVISGKFTHVDGMVRTKIARLNSNGTLDSGFSTGPGISSLEGILCIAEIPENDDLLVWDVVNPGLIGRLDADGKSSTTWTYPPGRLIGIINGQFITSPIGQNQLAWHDERGQPVKIVSLQPEKTGGVHMIRSHPKGHLLFLPVEETARINGITNQGSLITLNQDGSLNSTFLPNLISASRPNEPGKITLCAIMPNGQMVIGGDFSKINGVSRDRIARLNPDGSLDLSFRSDSMLSDPYAILLQSTGHVLVSGSNGLFRLSPNGQIDSQFVTTPGMDFLNNGLFWENQKMLVGPDDKFLVRDRMGKIKRLNTDGSIDSTFDPLPNQDSMGIYHHYVALPGGKYVIARYAPDESPSKQLLGLNADGTLDPSFGISYAPAFESAIVIDLFPTADNKIMVVWSGRGSNTCPLSTYPLRCFESSRMEDWTLPSRSSLFL